MTMLAATRRRLIQEHLAAHHALRTEEFARHLGVSIETLRRDLVNLEDSGDLIRVHGGAVPGEDVTRPEPPFVDRELLSADAKRAIGACAATFIKPGATVFVDIGTTALCLADLVPDQLQATVVTPSLRVAASLASRPALTVMVPGGTIRPDDLALSGSETVDFLSGLHPDIAFLGSGGLDADRGLTDFQSVEVAVKRQALANSRQTYVLADASKLGWTAPWRVARIDELTGIITDTRITEAQADDLKATGTRVVVAPKT